MKDNKYIPEESMAQNKKFSILLCLQQFDYWSDAFKLWLSFKFRSCHVPVSMLPYCSFNFFTESVYDLLPRELQLPSSTQQKPKVMSQKSGGEAGPPPSVAVASGRILLLFSLFRLGTAHAPPQKNNPCNSLYLESQSDKQSAALWSVISPKNLLKTKVVIKSHVHSYHIYMLVHCEQPG